MRALPGRTRARIWKFGIAGLAATMLGVVPVGELASAGAGEVAQQVAPDALPPLATPAQAERHLDAPQRGDFSSPPPADLREQQQKQPTPLATADDTAELPIVDRSATATTYKRADGSLETRLYGAPVRFKDAQGAWRDIDTNFVSDAKGGARLTEAPFGATAAPIAGGSNTFTVSDDNWSVGFGLEGAAPAPLTIDGAIATYKNVAPGTNLIERVTSTGLKEALELTTPPDLSTDLVYRFPLSLSNVTARKFESGEVGFVDAKGKVVAWVPAGRMSDSAKAQLPDPSAGVQVGVATNADGSQTLELRPNMSWLRDSARVWPVVIDPSVNFGSTSEASQKDAVVMSVLPTTNWNGSNQWNATAGHYQNSVGLAGGYGEFHTYQWFDVSAIAGGYGRKIASATWNGNILSNAGQISMYPSASSWSLTPGDPDYLTWNTKPGHITGNQKTSTVASGWYQTDITSWMQHWVDGDWTNNGFETDTAGQNWFDTFISQDDHTLADPYISVLWLPGQSTPTAPADDSVVMTQTPTLQSDSVTDPAGTVRYWYRVATTPDAATGQVVDSGWLTSPGWTVPAGVLQDGVTYYWEVFTQITTDCGWCIRISDPIFKFRVDMRLGSQDVSPNESLGGANVNLANGNLSLSTASPTFPTVGGDIGVSYSYNSQDPPDDGLTGSYYANSTDFTNGTNPQMVRADSQISFNWGLQAPIAALPSDNFYVRWTGTVAVPTTGSWVFGATIDDGVKIWINNTLVVNQWTDHPYTHVAGSAISLTAGVAVPIKIEYYDHTGNAAVLLDATPPSGSNAPVPSSWLGLARDTLPHGWKLSVAGTSSLAYDKATFANGQVILNTPDGSKEPYALADPTNSKSGYVGLAGGQDVIVPMIYGVFDVHATDGNTYRFHPYGNLLSVQSSTDVAKPAASTYTYNSDFRLSAINDPVSGRSIYFTYTSDVSPTYPCAPPPPGFDATSANPGMLCRVEYWTGVHSNVFYKSGQLARLVDPGSETTDFAYDTNGHLTEMRSPLAADTVGAGLVSNTNDWSTLVHYDSNGKVDQVSSPKAALTTDSRVTRSFTYAGPSETTVQSSGITGNTRDAYYDTAGRTFLDYNANGESTTNVWSRKDLNLATFTNSSDGHSLETTTIYDSFDRATDKYGPAPSDWFDNSVVPPATVPTYLPLSAYASQVPHTATEYDGGYQGVDAMYWNGDLPSGNIVARSFVTTTNPLNQSWGTGSPATGVNNDHFVGRYSGALHIQTTDPTWQFQLAHDDGARLWIDEKSVIDNFAANGTDTSAQMNLTAGWHSFRLDFHENTGSASFALKSRTGTNAYADIPKADFTPRYDLTTKVTDDDGRVTTTSYTRPEIGLATTETQDPTGLNLSTVTSYEAQSSSTYFREETKTLPGSPNDVVYTYYADTQTATPNTCGITGNQGGRLRKTTNPTPKTGTAIVNEVVYDAAGRVAGRRVKPDTWSCTTFDSRGRTATQTYPAMGSEPARTITYSYSVGGDPRVTSVSDAAGTITTTVDLAGRVVSYNDVWGKTTTSTYDAAGRLTDTVGPNGTVHDTLDNDGKVTQVTLDSAVVANPTYDTFGRLDTASYPSGSGNGGNGTSLDHIARDSLGRDVGLTWKTPGGTTITSDSVTRSVGDHIIDESIDGTDANPSGANFTYDAVGRLTDAYTPGHHQTFGFGAPSGCGTGSNANANKNTNRTTFTDTAGSLSYSYCYDKTDRLISTTTTGLSTLAYDDHGNTTTYGNATMTYDGADRHTTTVVGTTTVRYVRDATDRIIARQVNGTTTERYSFTGDGDSADATLDASSNVIERAISLPGGVILQKRSGGDVWSYPNIHGHVVATADASGTKQGSTLNYDPFGNALNGQPDNLDGNADYGWLGKNEKLTEHETGLPPIIEMGARQYSPLTGRFLEVDPVEGGSANDYDYVNADPINSFDLNGNWCWGHHCVHMPKRIKRFGRGLARVASSIANYSSIGSILLVAGCAMASAGTAGAAALLCAGAMYSTWATVGGYAAAAGGYGLAGQWGRAGRSAMNAGMAWATRNQGFTRRVFGSGRGFAWFQVGVHLPIATWKFAYNRRRYR